MDETSRHLNCISVTEKFLRLDNQSNIIVRKWDIGCVWLSLLSFAQLGNGRQLHIVDYK